MSKNKLLKDINTGWRFKQARLANWYPAKVPGVVHIDLMDNGIIDNPFFGLNERSVQWIDKEDWIYETYFDLESELFWKKNICLHFKGLDTYADVYLNNEKILIADNMFREWEANIKHIAKEKDNHLKVYFHSPIKIDLPKWEALPFHYKTSNDQSENGGVFNREVSIFARKAGYHYGWDWGPRLVTSGIWRPVIVEAWDTLSIKNVHYIQKCITREDADIQTVLEVIADVDIDSVKIEILNDDLNESLISVEKNLKKGLNKIEVDYSIKNPILWWSNGLGEAHLYTFNAKISINDKIIDSQRTRTGLRSIKLVREPDQYGRSFYFELNGVPVFSKGANYIPCDIFLPRVTKDIYKKTVLDAVNVNMNMLRVWGGGIYEDDYFYDLCDEYGILVWQDFMFACSLYPADGDLLENIRQEAIDNVKRLRNHPSIAVWCGNNECLDAWANWGWKEDYTTQDPKIAEKIWKQFYDQYFVILPEVVGKYDPIAEYTPSSPFTDIDGRRDNTDGDMHYWDPWQKGLSISTYNRERSRYFSEYGFQSFPELETVKSYAPQKSDWDISSDVMMWHQRGGIDANNTIERCLEREYGKPKDFVSFLYMSQVIQGDAMKIAMEAHRRDMGYCMGSLFWQHNDCWPVASWASRDYFGRWKAQHYFTRKAFRDILISPITDKNTINVYGISDRLTSAAGQLLIQVINLKGGIVNEAKMPVVIPANRSTILFSDDAGSFIKNVSARDIVIYAELVDDKENIYRNNYFLLTQKQINFSKSIINYNIKSQIDGYEIDLKSDVFARAVYLSIEGSDAIFEDNYFDILPGRNVKVKAKTSLLEDEFRQQLKIVSLHESRMGDS